MVLVVGSSMTSIDWHATSALPAMLCPWPLTQCAPEHRPALMPWHSTARVAHRGEGDAVARLAVAGRLMIDAIGAHQVASAHASDGGHRRLDVVGVVNGGSRHVVQRRGSANVGVQRIACDGLSSVQSIVRGIAGRAAPRCGSPAGSDVDGRKAGRGDHGRASIDFGLRGRQQVDDALIGASLSDWSGARDGDGACGVALKGTRAVWR